MSDESRELYKAIKAMCNEAKVSNAEVTGCLELVKYEILKEAWVKA